MYLDIESVSNWIRILNI